MKILILSLLISFNLLGQGIFTLVGGDIVYNGTELISNTINRDFEVGSELIVNGTFGANVDGWSGSGSTKKWYNTDWDAIGRVNLALDSATSTISRFQGNLASALTVGQNYKLTFRYYLPSANTGTGVLPRLLGGANVDLTNRTTEDAWTLIQEFKTSAQAHTAIIFYISTLAAPGCVSGDQLYIDDISLKNVSNFATNGNHSFDSSSTYKQAGTYSGVITASAAGNGTTNTISLASTLFTAVTNGLNYRFQVYAYTSTANTTLTFKLGDIVKTAIVSTVGMNVINFDFKATASTTGNILLYLDKAATVYIDDVSLKSGS